MKTTTLKIEKVAFEPTKKSRPFITRMLGFEEPKDRVFYLKSYWTNGGFDKEVGVLNQSNIHKVMGGSVNTIRKYWHYAPTIIDDEPEYQKEAKIEPVVEPNSSRQVSYSIDKIDALKELILAHQSKLDSIEVMQREADALKLEIENSYKSLI